MMSLRERDVDLRDVGIEGPECRGDVGDGKPPRRAVEVVYPFQPDPQPIVITPDKRVRVTGGPGTTAYHLAQRVAGDLRVIARRRRDDALARRDDVAVLDHFVSPFLVGV